MLKSGQTENKETFSEDVIQKCREISIESLVDGEVINAGSNRLKISCPFHKGDNDPSMIIYPDNSFFCFGCGVGGSNAITFISRLYSLSFPEAIRYLMKF
jgi:DNA primase